MMKIEKQEKSRINDVSKRAEIQDVAVVTLWAASRSYPGACVKPKRKRVAT